MNSLKIQCFSVYLCFLLCIPLFSFAQTNPTAAASQTDIDALKKSAVKVFIDCDSCDNEYIKTEITYVNYVRDRKEAQVHVLITIQSTGAGGIEYTMTFSGQQEFQGMDDIQKFVSNITQPEDRTLKSLKKPDLDRRTGKKPSTIRTSARNSDS